MYKSLFDLKENITLLIKELKVENLYAYVFKKIKINLHFMVIVINLSKHKNIE